MLQYFPPDPVTPSALTSKHKTPRFFFLSLSFLFFFYFKHDSSDLASPLRFCLSASMDANICKWTQRCHVRVRGGGSLVFHVTAWHVKHHYDKADYHPSVLAEDTCSV